MSEFNVNNTEENDDVPIMTAVRYVQGEAPGITGNVDLTGIFVQTVNGIAPDENGNVNVQGGNNHIGGGGGGGGGIHSLQRHGKRLKLWHEYVNVDQYGDWEAVYKPANFEEVIAVFAHGSTLTEEPKSHSAKGRTHPHYNDKVKVTVLGY